LELFTDNIIVTITAFLLSFTAFAVSAILHSKNKCKISLVVLIAGGLLLRLVVSSDLYLHPHDEKFHALVAKNITRHPLKPTLYDNPVHNVNYKDWSSNNVWLHKQPFPLWTIAASISILGNNEFAVRFPSVILSALGIWLIYLICMFFFTGKNQKRIAWMAAFLYAINGLILELTGGRVATDHYDLFFMVLILTAIYFTIKFIQTGRLYYNVLTGLFIGLAVLTKWLPAYIVLPVWILLVYDSDKFKTKQIVTNFLILTTVSFAVFLPWQIYIHSAFPAEAAYTSSFNLRHLTEVLDNQTGPFYFFFARMGTNYGELVYLPLVFLIIYVIRNHKDLKKLSIVVWIFVPLLFFSFSKTKMQAYILFIAPALFMISAWFWHTAREKQLSGINKYLKYAVLALMLILPVRYCIERVKPFSSESRNPEWSKNIKEFAKTPIPEKSLLFNYSRPIEAMFYADITAYSHLPGLKDLNDYLKNGYTVYINLNENIPTEVLNTKELVFVELE